MMKITYGHTSLNVYDLSQEVIDRMGEERFAAKFYLDGSEVCVCLIESKDGTRAKKMDKSDRMWFSQETSKIRIPRGMPKFSMAEVVMTSVDGEIKLYADRENLPPAKVFAKYSRKKASLKKTELSKPLGADVLPSPSSKWKQGESGNPAGRPTNKRVLFQITFEDAVRAVNRHTREGDGISLAIDSDGLLIGRREVK